MTTLKQDVRFVLRRLIKSGMSLDQLASKTSVTKRELRMMLKEKPIRDERYYRVAARIKKASSPPVSDVPPTSTSN